MTVTYVTRKWRPAMGGIETYSERLYERLARRCDLTLIALPGHANGMSPGPPQIVSFGIRSALRLAFARSAPDVAHVTDMASWPLALAARIRSRRTRLVLSAHGTDVAYGFRSGLRPHLYQWYLRLGAGLLSSAEVIANSRATLELVTEYGFTNGTVIPLGTDYSRRRVPVDRSFVLFSGRLVHRKGCRWFAESVLPELPDDVELRVAGKVWDPEEGEALLLPRVRSLGQLDQEALAEEYARALCVVVPNTDTTRHGFEGFGLVAAEAASAGGVVLASRAHGLEEAVIDGETGRLLPPGDAEAWKSAVLDVLGWSDAVRASHVDRTSQKARMAFSWERVAEETIRIYQDDRS